MQVLKNLVDAEGFEKYLHTRFMGHKRFSLEGAETTIPMLAAILAEAANTHVRKPSSAWLIGPIERVCQYYRDTACQNSFGI